MINLLGFIIDGENYKVDFKYETKEYLEAMGITKYAVAGSMMALGKRVNDMRDNEKFIVVDKMLHLGVVARVDKQAGLIEVIATVHQDFIYIKEGMNVYNIE